MYALWAYNNKFHRMNRTANRVKWASIRGNEISRNHQDAQTTLAWVAAPPRPKHPSGVGTPGFELQLEVNRHGAGRVTVAHFAQPAEADRLGGLFIARAFTCANPHDGLDI